MGIVRALAALVVIAVAISPLAGLGSAPSAEVPSVYADASQIQIRDREDKDRERKEKNRADEDDEDERGNRRQTEEERDEEREQQERDDDSPRTPTNAYAADNFQLEGHVTRLNCEAQPKEIVIRTLDGEATLYQGPRDPVNRIDRLYCGDLAVGDYIFVHEAHKRSEQSYDAYYLSCQQEREEGPDNTNDNEDDVDPNCRHIWNR